MTTTITISTGIAGRPPVVVVDEDHTAGTVTIGLPPVMPTTGHGVPPLMGLSAAPSERESWNTRIRGSAWARVFFGHGDGMPDWRHPVMRWYADRDITVHASAKDCGTAEEIRKEFDGIPGGAAYKRTYHHEPQGDGLDPAKYNAQWRLLRQVRDDHPNRDRITLVEVHNLWAARYTRADWRLYHTPYPDRIGWDVYWPELLPYEHPASTLGLVLQSLAETGMLDWELTELGAAHTRTGRTEWLTGVVDLATTYGCAAVGLWCSKRTADGVFYDYRPTTPAETSAYAALIARNQDRP